MSCQTLTPGVVVCRSDSYPVRKIMYCPTCKSRRRCAGYDAAWYGRTLTCLGCGDMWTDGKMHERPFKPRWRKERMTLARRYWAEAGSHQLGDYETWIKAQLGWVGAE